MSDYGFRISAEGVDVKTGDDKDMVVTSKYSILKGILSGSGTATVTRYGTETVITIAHNLGYIPSVQAFSDIANVSGLYGQMPMYLFDGAYTEYWSQVSADDTNIYLTFGIYDFD